MQVGEISSYNLEKDFSSFYYQIPGQHWDYVTRVLHNTEQVIRCQLRDGTSTPQAKIKYWNMDGSEAAQFTVGSGGVPYTNIIDMTWFVDTEKFCYMAMYNSGTGLGSSGYSVVQALPDGASPEVLVNNISTANTTSWSGTSASGFAGITCSNDNVYVKIGPELHEIDRSVLGVSGTWDWADLVSAGHVRSSTDCFHFGDGSRCMNMMFQDTTVGDYVLYTWYDQNIDVLYLRSISVSGTYLEYVPNRWTMLDVPLYGSIQYPIFINQLDTDSLHLMAVDQSAIVVGGRVDETPAYFNVFNIDEDLAAFLNVNSSDSVMPAGIGATSTITAKVANCWGTTLSGKLVQFWVSSGDGGVFPSYSYTDSTGRTTTTFTTGANVGISNVAVVVNEV